MLPENSLSTVPKIINAVTSIMGLSALGLLASVVAFPAALVQIPQDKVFLTFLVMVALVLTVLVVNMVYAYVLQRLELTFRVRVESLAEEGPLAGIQVELYKNGNLVQSSPTDDFGLLAFTVKLERKDELYVVVNQAGQQPNKAALYSAGQCQMTKTIRL